MKTRLIILFLLACSLLGQPALATVRASLDQAQTTLDTPVRLTIESDRREVIENLDTSELDKDFEIVERSNSSHVSMVNGTVSRKESLTLSLLAKRTGELTIPTLRAAGEQTRPLTLKVTATPDSAPSQDGGSTPGVMIETQWESVGKAYVQGQLNLVIRIYHRNNLLEASLDEPRVDDTRMLRLGQDKTGSANRNGSEYQTIERRYALFPQKSGPLTVPPIVLQLRMLDSSGTQSRRFGLDPFSGSRFVTLSSKALKIDVAPPAPGFTGPVWLPANDLILERDGLPEQPVQQGDAINLKLNLTALGLTAEQLPEVHIEGLGEAFKLYPDQPDFNNAPDGTTVAGTRSQTFVLIPSQTGSLEIPPIKVTWWNREQDRQQTTSLPATRVEVIPNPSASSQLPGPADQPNEQGAADDRAIIPTQETMSMTGGDDPRWRWLALASLAGWLLTIIYLLISRRRSTPDNSVQNPPSVTDLRPLLKQLEHAARANQAQETWQSLQRYARARWPHHPPATPDEWANRLGAPECKAILGELDAALFRGASKAGWQGDGVCSRLIPALDKSYPSPAHPVQDGVPALYPSSADGRPGTWSV